MKIGILKTDSVLPQLQVEFGNYPRMFERALGEAAKLEPLLEVEFVTYDVEQFEYPENISDCDGYVITGSKLSVYDDEPWIHKLNDYVVKLHQAKSKLVGICFGHQLIAMALGGHTEAAEVGWTVGNQENQILVQKPYMQPQLESFRILASHKDQVSILPQGAELIAESAGCPMGAYQIGEHILTFQGHIEFVKGYSRALMDLRRELLGEAVYNEGIESLAFDPENLTLARWILNFIDSP